MHIAGIDMSSAFHTVIRIDLIEILENILPEDEVGMARLLHSNTSTKGGETESFQSNKGSPQGESISRIFFNIFLEDSLRRARCEFKLKKPDIEHSCSKTEKSSLPKEIVYADDTDFIFKTKEEKNNMIETVNAVFPTRKLKVNEEKQNTSFYNLEIPTLKHGETSRN